MPKPLDCRTRGGTASALGALAIVARGPAGDKRLPVTLNGGDHGTTLIVSVAIAVGTPGVWRWSYR